MDEIFLDLGDDTTPQVVRIRAYVGVGLRRPARAPAPGPPGPRPRALGGDGGGDDACPPRPSSHRRFAIERHDGRSPNNTTVAATSTTRSPFWVIVEELVRYPRPRAGRSSETRFERRRKRNSGKRLPAIIASLNPTLARRVWVLPSTATGRRSPELVDGWIRTTLRSILRKRQGPAEDVAAASDHHRWPNASSSAEPRVAEP